MESGQAGVRESSRGGDRRGGGRGRGRERDMVHGSNDTNGNSRYMCNNTPSNLAMYKLSTFDQHTTH